MTVAAAGFRQFEALGLAESVRSGSSGSSTHAPTGSCLTLTLQPATVRCLRRMLNRPLDHQVNAFSELIWCIMKLCKQREQQAAFLQYVHTQPADLQGLLDWAADHLEATFEGATPPAHLFDARAMVTHWEAHSPLPPCTRHSLSNVIDTTTAHPLHTASTASHPDPHHATAVAQAATAVIRSFFAVWNPLPSPPSPQQQDGPVRRKLMFGSSRMAPHAAAPSPLTSTGTWRKDQPVTWVYSPEADIGPMSPAPARSPSPTHPTSRLPRSGDALDVDPGCSSTAPHASLPHLPSLASLHSTHKPRGSSSAAAAAAAALRRQHLAEAPPLDQDPDLVSLAAGSDMEDSLSVYLARQQETQQWPDRDRDFDTCAAAPRPPSPAAPRRQSRVMSAIRSLVLPSCMRHLAVSNNNHTHPHATATRPGRSAARQARAQQYAQAGPSAVTPVSSVAAGSGASPFGLQRSKSFERWIRQEAPVTPSPSFTAARVSTHSSDSDTTAARTAQWVIDAVQQAADRLALQVAAAAAAEVAAEEAAQDTEEEEEEEGGNTLAVGQLGDRAAPPAAAAAAYDSAACMHPRAAAAAAAAAPATDASNGTVVDSWTSWGSQQQQAAAAAAAAAAAVTAAGATLRTPQCPASESLSPSVSSLANSVGSAATADPSAAAAAAAHPDLFLPAGPGSPTAALPHPALDAALSSSDSLQASPPPLTRSDFPPSPMFPNLAPVAVPPPEIMEPLTPSASLHRAQPISPSMRLLRRSVGSWASDTPSAAPPSASPLDTHPPPTSPFGNASPVPPAASWASTISPHNSLATTPHPHPHLASPAPATVPALPLAALDPHSAAAPAPLSPIASSQFAGIRRDSWSSDYSNQSPVHSRPTDTVFAQHQHQQPSAHTHHQVLPVPTSALPSMRSLPQVPSRLGGSRRNHLSRAGSARSATFAAITSATSATPLADVIDDTGDSVAVPTTATNGDEAAAPADPAQSQDLLIDTHFFSDRGTTITGSADLDALDALHPQQSLGDLEALQSAFSGVSEQQLARAVTLDGLLIAAQQQLSRATSAAAPPLLPLLPLLPLPPAALPLTASNSQEQLPAVLSTASVPDLPSAAASDSDGRGGLSGLSVRLALAPQVESTSSEEEEAPQTLRHFGSFTGASEPAYLSGGRLTLTRTAPCYSIGQVV